MAFYRTRVFPWIMDKFLSAEQVTLLRKELLASACGRVLELGVGTGLNLPHYPAVDGVVGIDPNPGMRDKALLRARASDVRLEFELASGAAIPAADASFDTVVSTFTMCSIPELPATLHEVRRVLRPDGRFLVLEHGLSEEVSVQKWQRRLSPFNAMLAAGCRLDVSIRSSVEAAGFGFDAFRAFYADGQPKVAGYISIGTARPRMRAA
jgi:ubiquinone/menaquinone biosynthesis C-methylase UbiE